MRRDCKRVFWLSLGCLLAAGLIAGQTASDLLAAEPFVTAKAIDGVTEFEAIQDVETGLMWGKNLHVASIVFHPEAYCWEWEHRENYLWDEDGNPVLDDDGNQLPNPASRAGGYFDWRPPTVTEVLVAIEHGLIDYVVDPEDPDNSPCGIDFEYWEGHQGVNDPKDPSNPDSPTFGDQYYWTTCMGSYKGLTYRFRIRYNDGDYVLSQQAFSVLPVRGAPPDHSLCPKGCIAGRGDRPPKPEKPPKK